MDSQHSLAKSHTQHMEGESQVTRDSVIPLQFTVQFADRQSWCPVGSLWCLPVGAGWLVHLGTYGPLCSLDLTWITQGV